MLAGLLVPLALAAGAQGLNQAWQRGADFDMRSRAAEYHWFRQGIYPNRHLAGPDAPGRLPYTVYPPYAIPLFAIFFEPGGRVQGRLVVEALSLAAWSLMAWYGYGALRFAGRAPAALGAMAGLAIAGNGTALGLGQFSIPCVGLLVLQAVFLERDRPVAAGICWALAMLKPQVALAFALLFVLRRQWLGLAAGAAVLAALTLFCCAWTGVAPGMAIWQWAFAGSMAFAQGKETSGPGTLAAAVGVDVRTVQWAAVGLLGCLSIGLWRVLRRLPGRPAVLPLAGVCGALGGVLFYHRHYDNVMLYFTLIGCLAVAAARPSWPTVALALLTGLSLWVPQRLYEQLPGDDWLRPMVWSAEAALLAWWAVAGWPPQVEIRAAGESRV